MVIVNYELYLKTKISQKLAECFDPGLKQALSIVQFQQLVIKLYEYCQQLNIIRRRMQKLCFQTDKNQIIMPKLIDSEITRIDTKARQIGTAYSVFLLKQKRFRVMSNESKHFEQILKIIIQLSVKKCFPVQDSQHLQTQVNRLFRTNTFNTSCCWNVYLKQSKQKKNNTDFRIFRRTLKGQKSQIKPYVNNRTCFKSLKSRSPVISLWHPNSEYLFFTLLNKTNTQKSNINV